MLKFKAWRYKCEFCGKNSRASGAMKKHERGCTANPQRVCSFHKVVIGEETAVPPLSGLIELLIAHQDDSDHGLDALKDASEGCPCCMLAAIRQSGLGSGTGKNTGCIDGDGNYYDSYAPPKIGKEFNFKEEMARVWSEVNERAYQEERDY